MIMIKLDSVFRPIHNFIELAMSWKNIGLEVPSRYKSQYKVPSSYICKYNFDFFLTLKRENIFTLKRDNILRIYCPIHLQYTIHYIVRYICYLQYKVFYIVNTLDLEGFSPWKGTMYRKYIVQYICNTILDRPMFAKLNISYFKYIVICKYIVQYFCNIGLQQLFAYNFFPKNVLNSLPTLICQVTGTLTQHTKCYYLVCSSFSKQTFFNDFSLILPSPFFKKIFYCI